MRKIAHISDLHFGTEDVLVAEGLSRDLKVQKPDLVVASGDFTQRARVRQFKAARDFLRQIPFPQLCVPGNHDVPLYDVCRRFLAPLQRYRRYIAAELDPWWEDDEMTVLGINTARSFTWKSGRISAEQMKLIHARLEPVPAHKFEVLVTHHPFIPPPGEEAAAVDLVGRAQEAMSVIERARVDLLLAGHLHHGYTGDVRAYYPGTKRSIIVAQAGTALSRRVRGEPNAYNLLQLDGSRIKISVRVWNQTEFVASTERIYETVQDEWRPVSE